MITGKINTKMINKEKLFKGEKGLYLDIVLIETPNSEYSDYMIVQSTKKDEDSIILGNASVFKKKEVVKVETPEDKLPF